MENHFHGRGSVVRGRLPGAAVALKAAHEATVSGQIHLTKVTTGEGGGSKASCVEQEVELR